MRHLFSLLILPVVCLPAVLVVTLLAFPPATSAGNATLVKDIVPGQPESSPSELTVVSGVLYFRALTEASTFELWKSDGTADGTVRVKDIFPTGDASPMKLTASGGKLFFRAFDGPSYQAELWVSDGTDAGTVKLDINPAGASDPDELVDVRGVLYFSAYDPAHGRELWRSDGTPAGTHVLDLNPIPGFSTSPTQLTPAGSRLYFTADVLPYTTSQELLVTDGSETGTTLLFQETDTYPTTPNSLAAVGSRLYFQAGDWPDRELYVSDGTAAGTSLVKNINPSDGSFPTEMGSFGNILLFAANDGVTGQELWRSDGTAAGTYLLKDLDPTPPAYPYYGDSWPRGWATLCGGALFTAQIPGGGRELWITDGTESGTSSVKGGGQIEPNFEPRIVACNGEIFFGFDDGVHGSELWMTDGTTEGTVLAADVWPGPTGSGPRDMAVLGNAIYFAAYGEGLGLELWKYDPLPTPVSGQSPAQLALAPNYPNPFNPATTIAFTLDRRQHITLSVFDVRGALVRTLLDETMPGGAHEQTWDGLGRDGEQLASGVYFLQLRASDRTLVRKAVMLK